MAEHEAQAVAEGDGEADFDATDAEAFGGVEQSTEQAAAAKAPAAQTLADVIGDEEAEDALISALENGEFPQADEDSTDDSGQHTEESESTETDDETDDDAAETGQQDAKAPVAKEPKRIKVESPMVRRLNDLIRGGMSEADALAFLSKGKADDGETQEAQQTTEQKDPVEEKQAELGRLQDEFEAASEIFDAKETTRLLREITRAQGELTDLKMEARERKMQSEQQAKQGQADYEAKEKAALDEAGAMVPEFLTEGTPLRSAADTIAQTLPDQFFAKPDWPKRLLNLAWLEQHPGAPLPGAKANGSNGNGVKPLKNGTKAAALTTASGGQSGGSAMSRLIHVARTGEGSDEELDAALEALG